MAPTIDIRSLAAKDIPALVGLIESHASYEQSELAAPPDPETLARHLLSSEQRASCVVATADDQVVGYATVALEFSTWDADEFGHMDTLFVSDANRSAGIGAALFNEARALTAELGAARMEWQTPAWNHRAVRFYERQGATPKHKVRFSMDSSDAEANVATDAQVLERFSRAWENRDMDTLGACVTEDCVYSASIGPEPGTTFCGRAEVLEGIARMWEQDAGSVAEFGEVVEATDTIVRPWTYRFEDGSAEHGIDVFRFHNGKISLKDAYRKRT